MSPAGRIGCRSPAGGPRAPPRPNAPEAITRRTAAAPALPPPLGRPCRRKRDFSPTSDGCWIPERGSHRTHTVVAPYVRPRSSVRRSGKLGSLPSVLGNLAPPHARLIPAMIGPAPSAPALAGAHISRPGHLRAAARSPDVLPRLRALVPTHALPACSCAAAPTSGAWPLRALPRAVAPASGASLSRVPVLHVAQMLRQVAATSVLRGLGLGNWFNRLC